METWSGDLDYLGRQDGLLRVTELRVFDGSVTVVATSISWIGHWELNARLSDRGNSDAFRYVAENVTAVGQKVPSGRFGLAMSFLRNGLEMEANGEWREPGAVTRFRGTLFLE